MPTLQVYVPDDVYTGLVAQAKRVELSPGRVARYILELGDSHGDKEIIDAMRRATREQTRSMNKQRKVKTLV